jgi:mono/diheme cytochrome c family protein
MNRLGKTLGWVFALLAVVLAAGITFTIGWRPFIGPRTRALTARKFESTPTRLARGEYLVQNVTDCMGCHAEHDWTAHDAPVVPKTLGAGQDMNILKGFPGKVYAPNITTDAETGAGNWSDDQLARAIREGVSHDGRALFPFMPYPDFRVMSDEDLASIIVYLRSLPPVRKQLPTTDLIFPVKYLIRNVPQPLDTPLPEPDVSTPEKRGKYLVTIAGCSDCHTPQDAHGQPLPGMDFAGGFILDGPWGRVASANITPDPSGISYYDQATFIQAIRTGFLRARKLNQIGGGNQN